MNSMTNDRDPGRASSTMKDMGGDACALMPITDREFERLRDLVRDYFGIKLAEEKKSLVVSRLQNLVRDKGLDCFEPYIDLVENDRSGRELICLGDLISTNHTFFFRENEHFDYFMMKALPEIEARAQNENRMDVRIWSAGCAGGDEAYSLALCLMDYFEDRYSLWDAGVLATDISDRSLAEARRGVYSEKRLTQVPRRLFSRYFTRCGTDEFEISRELKEDVTFRRFNLKNREFPFKQAFDVISCRNVMIYFEQDMKEHLVGHFYSMTRPGGYLFIGHSETLNRKKIQYAYVKPGIYQRGE